MNFIHICTDGSKDGYKVGSAVFENHFISKMGIPKKASLSYSWNKGFDLASSYISQNLKDKFVICSDCLSVLSAIKT